MAKVQGKFYVDTIAIPNDDKIKSFKGINEYYKVLDTVMYTNYFVITTFVKDWYFHSKLSTYIHRLQFHLLT